MFDSSVQVTGSSGLADIKSQTHTFGPLEIYNQISIFHRNPPDTVPYFRFWMFTGNNVIGSPYMLGSAGNGPPNCIFNPSGPIIGVKSYLSSTGYFCGVDLAYNTCSCTS